MSISTSVNYNQTRNEIIYDALMLIQVLGEGETPDSGDLDLVNRSLNRMVKAWQAQGIHLFGATIATVFPVLNTAKYSLNNGASYANATNTYYSTQLSADEAAGQTVLSIDSNTNMTAADYIGIKLDDGSIQWTTIVSSTSTTVTITDALTSVASEDNYVFFYTTKINRPLRIIKANSYNISAGTEIPLTPIAYSDYFDLPNKLSTGDTPVQWYYDPQITAGDLYIWPVPENITNLIKIKYQRPFADLDSATDNVDFPQEWLDAIVYNLAVRIAPFYSKYEEMNSLAPLAVSLLDKVLTFDNDPSDIIITTNRD